MRGGTPEIYDCGDQLIDVTDLATASGAIVNILTHYEEIKNRDAYIHDITISQNLLLKIAQKADPQRKFKLVPVKTADSMHSSYDGLAKSDYPFPIMAGFILVGIFAEGYGQPFQKVDNEL